MGKIQIKLNEKGARVILPLTILLLFMSVLILSLLAQLELIK